ncbi:hypothetical protein H2200_002897 [Cladophialophora chaetospira]|uniref:Fumarylacetoacetase-like C-terminal domain-containing protein n=1 Tax=Cladophialophora chaetospira TaxID=386627 RepID=A0AA38XGJ6_9EURO|nr:hypothetical protein H2200_002897 [Cladophialophora chaetospira]
MAPVTVPWSRLIRFVSAEDNEIYFGDAVVPDDDFDIGLPENLPSLKARIIKGDALSSTCTVTDKTVQVKKLLGPLTTKMVPSIRCIGGNYLSHLRELGVTPPKYPQMFAKTSNALAGYGDDILIPKIAQDDQMDYEAELAFVIGRDVKNVKKEDALDYVLGYTSANDVSARKWQLDPELLDKFPPPQVVFGKSFDGFCPIGPAIISTRTLKDPHVVSLRTLVNGEQRQSSNTKELQFNIPEIIEFLSQSTTLNAGSIVLTGAPGGVGFAMKPQVWLKDGDEVQIRFGKVGTLVNRFVNEV